MSEATPLLDQDGVRITSTHLSASGKSFKWNNLGIVRLTKRGFLKPTFQLIISTKKDAALCSIFETQDAALAKKIEAAINDVSNR